MNREPLYIESHGEGPQLVLLHGWGMHSGVFKPIVDELRSDFNVLVLDLPGHGDSQAYDGFNNIDMCTDYLLTNLKSRLKGKLIFCGWSTGSLITQNIAINYPELVEKIVLITGTPSFETKPDWLHGVKFDVLEKFKTDLTRNFEKTLSRFLALQFMHSEGQKENLRLARELVFAKQVPDMDMLQAGLELLKSTDLRAQLDEIKCDTLILNGERDTLVPTMAARYLAEKIEHAKSVIFRSSGHAPFLSSTKQFNDNLKQFLL